MKLSVKRFAELTGVSIRTLRYYDERGLLKPDFTDPESGYRYYGENALSRMQEILFYRELDFPLKTIGELLSTPDYNKTEALRQQKQLLLMKKARLERIIAALERAEKGGTTMDFSVFDSSELTAYRDEVRARWGSTDAYKESEKRTASYGETQWQFLADGMSGIISEFAQAMKSGKASDEAKDLAEKLKAFITATQYTCTDEILLCLGEMYIGDERFKANIDSYGEGTAQFMHDAIKAYCYK